nr:MAG TPA: NlpC/P60 family [Caudoviricetes sp.]
MIRDLIGTPFSQMDCFALVRKCYEIERGIIIPPARAPHDRVKMIFAEFLDEISKHWRRTEKKSGVCAALRYDTTHPKIVTHFGYMIDENHIIHTTTQTGAIVEPLKNYEKLVEGYYDYA